MENNMPWRIAETNSIREEAKKRGIELVYTDAQSQTAKQVSDVEDMIAQGVDYILLAPREEEGLAPALAAAKAAGIPVILIDRAAKGEAGVDYVTLIASDFIEEGKRTAQWIIDNHGTKGNIIVLEGTQGASAATERQTGFEEVMKNYPDMKIIAKQTADFTRADGQKVMENFIQAHGKDINFVYAHNDEMAIGAIQAIKAAGMIPGKDIILTSIDGEKDALQAIVAGELGVSVECSPFFGPIAFDTIAKLEAGETVPTFIKNEDRLFDANNAEEFVNTAF
jgi:ribose transport system substrate-binding protein